MSAKEWEEPLSTKKIFFFRREKCLEFYEKIVKFVYKKKIFFFHMSVKAWGGDVKSLADMSKRM